MSPERRYPNTPEENFSWGFAGFNALLDLGDMSEGKVRQWWSLGNDQTAYVTTDRASAFDVVVGAIPGKGQVLNKLSAFWFEETKDIVPNHLVTVPHPNILIARDAVQTLPIEVVLRRYMAKSSTDTSVYKNYMGGKRNIYGIDFPDGLRANEAFPTYLGRNGVISTPTTKAIGLGEHDQMRTNQMARVEVDDLLGDGTWDKVLEIAYELFETAQDHLAGRGLKLADTKLEFGVDKDGTLMVIDELFTPDSSRFWLAQSYEERLDAGENPESFDKEILRRWLADHGFTGEGEVPVIDDNVITQMAEAYRKPYSMITGEELEEVPVNPHEVEMKILQYAA